MDEVSCRFCHWLLKGLFFGSTGKCDEDSKTSGLGNGEDIISYLSVVLWAPCLFRSVSVLNDPRESLMGGERKVERLRYDIECAASEYGGFFLLVLKD